MGTGYTRNDTSNNIADGNIINASDLDGEFDAVESAFNSSTGHTHDGTAAEGGAITVVGPVQDLVVSATEVKPKTTNTLDLGTSGLLYKDAYLQGNMYFRDTALKIVSSADGQLDIDADVELELVAPTVDIDASTALTVDTASTTFTSTLFNVTGSANITGDLDVDNININGNTIISTDTNGDINISPDGTGTVVIDTDLDVDNINVNGNTVSSTDTNGDINLSPNGTGTVVINTDLDVDNININGNTIISTDTNGNIALTPNGTGEVDISKVDIDSGAIDGTVIGANSAAAITGTTITGTSFVSSGDMTFGDSDKAIFGAGSDLQIYHDGSNSIINDAGTGSLKFQYGGTDGVVFDSSGNVIIGSGGLDVSGIGGTYTALNMRAGAGYPVIYGQTTATTTNSPAMQIVGATSGASAGGAAEFLGIIQIAAESDSSTNGAGYMNFFTGSGGSVAERMRIDSSGNLMVGKTVSDLGATAGIELNGQYDVGYFTRSAEKALVVNRLSTDGTIAEFRKDGSSVGSIGVADGDNLFISSTASAHGGLKFNNTAMAAYVDGANSDNTMDVGTSAVRFKDLYLSGGVYLGGTGSANHLDDYEEGTWTPSLRGATVAGTYTTGGAESGTYRKIGNTVYVSLVLNGSISGDSGAYEITGLPFVPELSKGQLGVMYNDTTTTSGIGLFLSNSRILDEENIFVDNNTIYFTGSYTTS